MNRSEQHSGVDLRYLIEALNAFGESDIPTAAAALAFLVGMAAYFAGLL